jgi:hypothetical protein
VRNGNVITVLGPGNARPDFLGVVAEGDMSDRLIQDGAVMRERLRQHGHDQDLKVCPPLWL